MIKEIYHNLVYDIKKNPFRPYFALSFINLIIFCAIFNHGDVRLFYRWGLCIWDVIFQGNIREYFAYTKQFDYIGNPYSVLIYIPLAIWNFPTWLLHYLNPDVNLNSQIFWFWSKLFHVACLYVTVIYIRNILKYFKIATRWCDLAVVFCFGSASMIFSIGEAGQDETFYLMIFTIGLYNLFIEKIKTSYCCFAFSIVCAPFMILPTTAAILSKRFNIFKFLSVVSAFLIFDKAFSYWWGYANRGDKNISMDTGFSQYFNCFFEHFMIQPFYGDVSVFAIVAILILGICYLYPQKEKYEQNKSIINYSAILLLSITLLCWNHPYRLCICIPYLICAIVLSGYNKKDLKTGFLLIFLFELTRILVTVIKSVYYAYDNSPFTFINKHFNQSVYLSTYLENKYILTLNNSAIYAVSAFTVFYILCKSREKTKCNIPLKFITTLYVVIPFLIISLYFGVFWFVSGKIHM